MKEDKQERKILNRQVITDQSDPRMVEFRESYGEFQPGCKRKTVRLEITEYEHGPDKLKLATKVGYYEGERPPGYREFFRKLYQKALDKVMEEEKRRKASDKSS